MKTSKYLPVIMFISAIWILLDVQSPAQGFSLELPFVNRTQAKSTHQPARILTQNLVGSSDSPEINKVNKDLRLQDIKITRDSEDKSLITIAGSINNRSEQPHYVYYIVARFISNDTSIKQTIIPLNIDIEPGQSKLFTHEISTNGSNSILLETVKPVVVKYEYR
jgi:hypothetical protein